MSFGFSAGDILCCIRLAHKVWKEARDAPHDFQSVRTEVASFKVVLEEVHESISKCPIDASKRTELDELLQGCNGVLLEFQDLLHRYKGLTMQSKRTWDRLRWRKEPIENLRSRLISHTTLLTSFRSGLHGSSLTRIEKLLKQLALEHRLGHRDTSVLSESTIESVDLGEDVIWSEISWELEDVGITPSMITEHKHFIISWIKKALLNREFDELSPCQSGILMPQQQELWAPPDGNSLERSLCYTTGQSSSNKLVSARSQLGDSPVKAIICYEVNVALTDICIRCCAACRSGTRYSTFGEVFKHLSKSHPNLVPFDLRGEATCSSSRHGSGRIGKRVDMVSRSASCEDQPMLDPPKSKRSRYSALEDELITLGALPTELLPLIDPSACKETQGYQGLNLGFGTSGKFARTFLGFSNHKIKNIYSNEYLGYEDSKDNGVPRVAWVGEDSASCWRVNEYTIDTYQLLATVSGREMPLSAFRAGNCKAQIILSEMRAENQSSDSQWTLECKGEASSLFNVIHNSYPGLRLDVDADKKLCLSKRRNCASQLWSFLPGQSALPIESRYGIFRM